MNWLWKLLGYAPSDPESTIVEEKFKPRSVLSKLRKRMAKHKIGIYIVLEQDEHQSEYVADTDRRVRFLSNFTGSAGTIVVGSNWAELATDSRYYLIASKQLSDEWTLRKLGQPNVASWEDALIERALSQKVDVGVDPRFINSSVAQIISERLSSGGLRLVPIFDNLVDEIWTTKPLLPAVKITPLSLKYTGRKASDKIAELRQTMKERGVQTFVTFALDEIAWVLNLRGGDVPYVPIFKSFLVVSENRIELYADIRKLSVDLTSHEGVEVRSYEYDKFWTSLNKVTNQIWIPGWGSWGIQLGLNKKVKNSVITEQSPLNIAKAVKNNVEIKGIHESQVKCSISIVRYLAWLGERIESKEISEYEGALKLLEIRKQLPDFRGNSFETISATGPNASSPHYAPEPEGSAIIRKDQVYLLDSGSHFLQGSTDITRTVHYGEPKAEEIKAYTLVLKGQLAVSSCVFPTGTSGFKLDILARQYLWQEGMDYGHGTGHGIGSYLNIHELPLGIGLSRGPESELLEHHFVSDEPGYYKDNEFGIRLENDILVVDAFKKQNNPRVHDAIKYLTFEIMTLVPYEPKLIDADRLTTQEKSILNKYHRRCREVLSPYLKEPREIAWLERSTQEIQ